MNKPSIPPGSHAPLYLLDDLDAGEMRDYLSARRNDPAVQAAEREAAESFADLALSVPQIAPPEFCLTALRAQILEESRPLPVRLMRRAARIHPAWAAAACFAALAAWSYYQQSAAERELAQWKHNRMHAGFPAGAEGVGPDAYTGHGAVPGAGAAEPPGLSSPGARGTAASRNSDHRLIQDRSALMSRLRQLEQRNARRFESVPGLNRPVIFEMQNPAGQLPGGERKLTLSSGKVGDILADALLAGSAGNGGSGSDSPDKTPFRLGESGRDDEILIESGMRDLSVFALPDEIHVRNLGLPVDRAAENGLQPLPDGSGYYESRSNLLWRQLQTAAAIGTRPPPEFDPGTAGAQNPPASAPAPAAAENSGARAFPIFDESTGEGSIILQNLPPAEPGMAYQLWFADPELPQPFSPGLMPEMENGSGRVFFDLGRTGYAPVSCYITQEPAGGSAQPTGKIILKGP